MNTVATLAARAEATRRLPGTAGVWVFIAADMCMFGLLFLSYMMERSHKLELFNRSQQALDPDFGGINTLILLTSSWFVVLGVQAARAGTLQKTRRLLALAIVSGVAFGVSKLLEYSGKLGAGISMLTNDFYMFYYVLTGIHFLHVIAGVVVLAFLWTRAREGLHSDVHLETGASYWHMVDLLWIIIFPLLYLIR